MLAAPQQFTREAINIEEEDKVVKTTATGLYNAQGIIFNLTPDALAIISAEDLAF